MRTSVTDFLKTFACTLELLLKIKHIAICLMYKALSNRLQEKHHSRSGTTLFTFSQVFSFLFLSFVQT